MSNCYICLEPFNTNNGNDKSSIEITFSCYHKICMNCIPDLMRNQDKLDSFEIKCFFQDCKGNLPIDRISTLPKNENYERIINELFILIRNTNNIRNSENENLPKNDFLMSLSDHCPNCKKLTVELENVDACCVITCLGCQTKFCKACKYYMSYETYLIYRSMVLSHLEYESVIAYHIKNFHNQKNTFIPYTFMKSIQKNEKLYKIQELGRIHTTNQKDNILLLHDIQQLIRNVNEKYELEPDTIEKIYLGTYHQKFSTMSEINHYRLLEEKQHREYQILNLSNLIKIGTIGLLSYIAYNNINFKETNTANAFNVANIINKVIFSKSAILNISKDTTNKSAPIIDTETTNIRAKTDTYLAAIPVITSTIGISTGLSEITASSATITTTCVTTITDITNSVVATTTILTGSDIFYLSLGIGILVTLPLIAGIFISRI
jgi:hypothetical protein